MFKKRIFWAFGILALASVIQGVMGYSTLRLADQNVQRGRVANDLLVGFVDVLTEKQRLRILLCEGLIGRSVDEGEVTLINQRIHQLFDRLESLSARASSLYENHHEMDAELTARAQAIRLLRQSFRHLNQQLPSLLKAANSGNMRLGDINRSFDMPDGQDFRTLIAESISRERLATARDRAAANASLQLLNALAISATVTLTLIAVGLALYFTKALNQPLLRIAEGAKALESGNLEYRIPENMNDEFSDLAKAVNRMARELSRLHGQEIQARAELERLVQERTHEVQEGLHRLEKLDLRRRQMFADISHELKTPTTAIRGEAEITLRGRDRDIAEYKEALQRIIDCAKHLGLVIEDMLTLARSDIDSLVMDRRPLALLEVLTASIEQVQPQALKQHIKLSLQAQSAAMVLGDQQRLKQLFGIVLENAVAYSHPGGEVTVQMRDWIDAEGLRQSEVTIADQGIGIEEHELSRVWDRHFRGQRAKTIRPEGNGLGLPLASALTRAHFGQIHMLSTAGTGTRVVITLPVFENTLERAT